MIARVANALWLASARRHHRELVRALADPERAQAQLLRRILRDNAGSRVGRRRGFATVDSPEAFRRRVPIQRFDAIADDVDAIRRGEEGVLTVEPVRRLCPSGGTVAPKRVPFTRRSSADLARGVGAWMTDLAARYPALRGGPAYWSVSPAIATPREPDTVVPVGFDDDAAYLGRALEPLVRRVLVAPPALRHARPLGAFRYATLRALLATPALRLVSVWHPSFFALLLDARAPDWDRLVRDVAAGTLSPPEALPPAVARALTRDLRPDPRRADVLRALGPDAPPSVLWPELAVVSAWGDAAAAGPLRALAARLGGVPIQPKGLLATEAMVTLPFGGRHPVALTSTYVELLGDDGRAVGVHEARVGAAYEVVITTSGGLYRYRLGDRVRVDGRVGATPSLRLIGRADRVVDLVGEKLSEAAALDAIARAFDGEPPAFALLAPHAGGYALFVDRAPADPGRAEARLRDALRRDPGYRYAVELGQLAPARLALTAPDAPERFLARRAERGQRLGDIKPAALADDDDWMTRLDGRLIDPAPETATRPTAGPRPRTP